MFASKILMLIRKILTIRILFLSIRIFVISIIVCGMSVIVFHTAKPLELSIKFLTYTHYTRGTQCGCSGCRGCRVIFCLPIHYAHSTGNPCLLLSFKNEPKSVIE